MKKSRFTDSQILSVLKQAENDIPAPELCREHAMSSILVKKSELHTQPATNQAVEPPAR